MNQLKISTCCTLFAISLIPVVAQAKCPGMSTVEMNECAAIDLEKANNSMKATYNKLFKTLELEEQNFLHNSQVSWILYSRAWCMVETSGSKGGSIRASETTYCLQSLTREREKQLKLN